MPNPKHVTWNTIYRKFMDTADWILDKALSPTTLLFDQTPPSPAALKRLISSEVDALYTPHKGDPIWDEAYQHWNEVFNKEEKS